MQEVEDEEEEEEDDSDDDAPDLEGAFLQKITEREAEAHRELASIWLSDFMRWFI